MIRFPRGRKYAGSKAMSVQLVDKTRSKNECGATTPIELRVGCFLAGLDYE